MPKEPLRSFRAPDEVWQAAQARAAERGVSVSSVLNSALVEFAYAEPDDDEVDGAN